MRVNWNILKIILLFSVVVLLYAFTSDKNTNRIVESLNIEFVDNKYPFLTEENVSKLLIQKNVKLTGVPKDILDLNELRNSPE